MSQNAQKCNNNFFLQTRLQHRQWELSTINSPVRCWRRVFSWVLSIFFKTWNLAISSHSKPFLFIFYLLPFVAKHKINHVTTTKGSGWRSMVLDNTLLNTLQLVLFYHIVITSENTMHISFIVTFTVDSYWHHPSRGSCYKKTVQRWLGHSSAC